jgi:hypothetical protein
MIVTTHLSEPIQAVPYVCPHLEFVVPARSPWLQGDKDTLERVQERAVRMVSRLKGKHIRGKCAELGLKTLEERRTAQDMVLVHKFLTEKGDSGLFQRMFNQQRSRTRQAAGEHVLCVQYARTDPRKHSVAKRTVKRWNRLPDTIKSGRKQ